MARAANLAYKDHATFARSGGYSEQLIKKPHKVIQMLVFTGLDKV